MNEVSPNYGHFEVDDPTQPFSRTQIRRMQRAAEDAEDAAPEDDVPYGPAEDAVLDELAVAPELPEPVPEELEDQVTAEVAEVPIEGPDWFMLAGRRIQISLAAFAEIGSSGQPAGMLSCTDSCLVYGEVGGMPDAPRFPLPRTTGVHPAAAQEDPLEDELPELAAIRRASRRRWLAFLGVLGILGLGAWALFGRGHAPATDAGEGESAMLPEPEPEPKETGEGSEPPAPSESTELEPSPERGGPETLEEIDDQQDEADEGRRAGKRRKSKARHRTSSCKNLRRDAEESRRLGHWAKLERQARSKSCWPTASQALGLRLQALFELGRYQECVDIGTKSRSKEANKWGTICQRAL